MGILENKRAIIIGASGDIGYACAEKCINEGAAVYGSYRTWNEKLRSLSEKTGGKFTPFELDLSSGEQIIPIIKKTIKELGGIDILINAAGINKPCLLYSTPYDIWNETLSVNLTSMFNCIKAVTVPMAANKKGAIINISSVYGIKSGEGQGSYSASKAGAIALSKTAALELAAKNIRVNVIAPGYVDTKMLNDIDKGKLDMFKENIPMKRFAQADEIAELCAFLASDRSSYITGQVIAVDGGLTAK